MTKTSPIAAALSTLSARKTWIGTLLASACGAGLILCVAVDRAEARDDIVVIRGPWACPRGGICHCRSSPENCAPGCSGTMTCGPTSCSCSAGNMVLIGGTVMPHKGGTTTGPKGGTAQQPAQARPPAFKGGDRVPPAGTFAPPSR